MTGGPLLVPYGTKAPIRFIRIGDGSMMDIKVPFR